MNNTTVDGRFSAHILQLDWSAVESLFSDELGQCIRSHLVLEPVLRPKQIRRNAPGSQEKISFWRKMITRLMTIKRNGGKSALCQRILCDALDATKTKTGEAGLMTFLRAFHRSLILEDVRSMKFGSTKLNKLVCVSPTKMISVSLRLLLKLYPKGKVSKPAHVVLSNEWCACAEGDSKSIAISKKRQCIAAATSANL
jgi:ribosomal protein S7